jgi:hypothetical protein
LLEVVELGVFVAWIEVELAREVLVDGEVDGVLVLDSCEFEVGEPVEAGVPRDVLGDLVVEGEVDVGTPLVLGVMPFDDAIARDAAVYVDVGDDIGEGCQV